MAIGSRRDTEEKIEGTYVVHPDRKTSRMKPLKAMSHFRKLIADKEDTEQVFHIIQSLSGKTLIRDLKRFAATPEGAQRIKERRYLQPILDDHDTILKTPAGSVGHAYVEFMRSQGLSSQGLIDEYERFGKTQNEHDDLIQWYSNRLRDTHDLLHILTGYSRDALGETCVLATSYSQHFSPGVIFISVMGGFEIRKYAPKDCSVMGAVFEGKRNGKHAQSIVTQDIPALLAEPLDAARKRMGFVTPVKYNRVHTACYAAGIDPYLVIS
ncbi:MAG: hypothetical protein COA43_12795 [Robiginitomaculum sp.]|nr:MAG: hypothetical protein COA43_12795 [Robiginitomaculum sp.]